MFNLPEKNSPHVLLLGAGASLAALPEGDINGRKIPLMNNLVELLNLQPIFAEYNIKYQGENFEAIYDNLVNNGNYSQLIKNIEHEIENYFSLLKLPEKATIYDYLVLSLTSKDIIATFNWDPFLSQAFQRNMNVIGFQNMPKIIFLHGNVSIGICRECKQKGWIKKICEKCNNIFSPSKLLYPVSKKDYLSDKYIYGEWQELKDYIKKAYLFTIFGYSAPVTDIEAKKLMLEVWNENFIKEVCMLNIIDIKPKAEIINNWKNFINKDNYTIANHFFNSYLAKHPRISCESYHNAIFQQCPSKENNLPKDVSLKELQEWIIPLVK